MAKTKQKTSGVNIEDLKKSLKTLTSEMNPEQLKRANDTLEKLEATSKQDTVKNDEIQKTNLEIKKSLGKEGDVNKSLQDLLKYYKFANEKLIKKLDEGNKSKADQDKSRSRKNLSDIKYDQPITVKEALKETVAGAKGLASKAKGLGSGIINAFKNPKGTLESMAGGIKGTLSNVYKTGKDIFSTPEGYTAEGGRFGEAHAKTDAGQREILALKKEKGISLEEARDQVRKKGEASYADLSKREKEISGVKEKQKFLTSQGFDPNSKDVKQLAQLTDAKNKADIRNTPAIAAQASPLATLVSKEAALAPVQKANDAAEASAKESEKQFLAANPEGDNIKSAQEITADATKEDLEISKQLLETTKESLLELRGIKEALSGGANQPQKPEPKKEGGAPAAAAGAEVAAAESGPGIGDAIDLADDLRGKGKGGLGKAGGKLGKAGKLGGKILGGLGKAAKFLGPAAALAGAAYSGFEGYQNTAENFDLKEGEEASFGQKASSTLGGVASGMTFGLLDEKSAAQGIHKAGSAIGDFFTGGKEGGEGALNAIGKMIPGVGLAKSAYDLYKGNDEGITKSIGTQEEFKEKTFGSGDKEESERNYQKTITEGNVLGGSKEAGALFTKKGETSGSFVAETEDAKLDSSGKSSAKFKDIFGMRESGGFLSKDKYTIQNATDTGIGENEGADLTDVSKKEYKELESIAQKGDAKGVDKRLAEIQLSRSEKNVSTGASGFSMSQKDIDNAKNVGQPSSVGQPSLMEKVTSGIGRAIPGVGLAMGAYSMFKGNKKETIPGGGQITDPEAKDYNSTYAEQVRDRQDIKDSVQPTKPSAKSGELSKSSLEYTDLDRERAQSKPSSAPVIMNNSSNNSTTKIMPMKGDPRPNGRGSAYDKYIERTSSF